MGHKVTDILHHGAVTFEERHQIYGDNYKHIGKIIKGLFPEGIHLDKEEDMMKMYLIIMICTKLSRYAETLKSREGGHKDSAHDAMVYAAMLEDLT